MKDALLLAGGRGTRLSSVVSDRPKPMALIDGVPFLEILIGHLASQGIEHVHLAIGHMATMVIEYFSQRKLQVTIDFIVEEKPLGTGGAIVKALRTLMVNPLLVVNGDTFLDFPYGILEQTSSPIAMGLTRVDDISRYGGVNMQTDGSVTGFSEKGGSGPGLINAGIYLIRPDRLDFSDLPEAFSWETAVLSKEAHAGRLQAAIGGATFIDIGIPSDYLRAKSVLGPWLSPHIE